MYVLIFLFDEDGAEVLKLIADMQTPYIHTYSSLAEADLPFGKDSAQALKHLVDICIHTCTHTIHTFHAQRPRFCLAKRVRRC